MMIKIVPDTSSLIRGFTSYLNNQRQLINLAVSNKVTLYGSSETYREFERKIHSKNFKRFLDPKMLTPQIILNNYGNLVTLIEPSDKYKDLAVVRDPNDDMFVKVALTVGSNIVVSEDKDLLSLKNYSGIRFLTAESFIQAYRNTVS